MSLTEVVAIIGCITGCCSLVLSFINFLRGRTNLKIEFPQDEYHSFYFNKLYNHWHVVTDKQAIIGIKFINKSREPITIASIDTTINNKKYWIYKYGIDTITNPVEDMDEDSIVLPMTSSNDNDSEKLRIDMRKQISTPLRLESYGIEEGYLFYNYFPNLKSTIKIEMEIKTSRGKKKTSLWIDEHQCSNKNQK